MNEKPGTPPNPNAARVNRSVVTSRLLEAFLACPTKCRLLSEGEVPSGGEYAAWAEARRDSHRLEGIRKVTAHALESDVPSSEPGSWKNEAWPFAVGRTLRVQDQEAEIALVQRIPDKELTSSLLVPVRFAPANKLSAADKLVAAYEAMILSKATGMKAGVAKIVHGEKWSTFSVKVSAMSRAVRAKVSRIVALLSDNSPPDLVLNRHCPECGFHDRCRNIAVEKDDLSLLSQLTDKERAKFRGKGIFTITQLSYTFRPRRRAKRLAARPERYHHALKARAIRKRKTHVVGNPVLHVEGTPVFFDVEGLPDRDFYYLIGIRVEGPTGLERHSLWADVPRDERRIWESFVGILNGINRPTLVHYGSYEKTFLKKMQDRYGGPPEHSAAGNAISSSVNLLSVIYAQIYFPSYSNGLKEIARFLGFEWADSAASGVLSIVWRHQWETSREPSLREKLLAYNADDCEALCLVANAIAGILVPAATDGKPPGTNPEIIRTENLGKNLTSKWKEFKSPLPELERINETAYWNYQRERVFVRTGLESRAISKRPSRAGGREPKRRSRSKPRHSVPSAANAGRQRAGFWYEPSKILSSAGTA